jgi:hypothetical protein
MLVWNRIEKEVTEDGSKTSEWVNTKGSRTMLLLRMSPINNNVVAGDLFFCKLEM